MDEQMQQQIVQLVQAAMQGDQQAQQQIQQIVQAAQNGDQEAMQIAQMIEQVMQQMQQKAKFGAKLNYIHKLRGDCPEGYETQFYKKGGKVCRKCVQKVKMKEGGQAEPMNAVDAFKCGRKMRKKACKGTKFQAGGDVEMDKCGSKMKKKTKKMEEGGVSKAIGAAGNMLGRFTDTLTKSGRPNYSDIQAQSNQAFDQASDQLLRTSSGPSVTPVSTNSEKYGLFNQSIENKRVNGGNSVPFLKRGLN